MFAVDEELSRVSVDKIDDEVSLDRNSRGRKRCSVDPLEISRENDSSQPRTRPRRTSRPRILYDASLSTSSKRKRSERRRKHRRHISKISRHGSSETTKESAPEVNPIFVWVEKDDTKIVEVVCKDYDLQNRIRLLKTANGWRAVPITGKSPPPLVNQPAFANLSSSSVRDQGSTHEHETEHSRSHTSPVPIDSHGPKSVESDNNENRFLVPSNVPAISDNELVTGANSPAPVLTSPIVEIDDEACNPLAVTPGSLPLNDRNCGLTDTLQMDEHSQHVTDNAVVEESVNHSAGNSIPLIAEDNAVKLELVSSPAEGICDANVEQNQLMVCEGDETNITSPAKQVEHPSSDKQEPVPMKLHSLIMIKSENEDVQESNATAFPHQPTLRRSPLCQTLKISKPSIHHRPTLKSRIPATNLKPEPLPAHIHSRMFQSAPKVDDNHISPLLSASTQNEPLDLGKGTRDKIVEQLPSPKPSRVQNAPKNSRLLDLLLTPKRIPKFEEAKGQSDPLEQLKNVLSNPKYMVPDPLLVPKCRLSALVSCPGEEIPRLLSQNAWRDLSFHSILSDPDVLVVSLSHLQSLLKKPINEDEILTYQKQTEEIRSRLRQQCFNNNNNNGNLAIADSWNPYYLLPNYHQQGLPINTSCYSSVSNLGFPSLPLPKSSSVNKVQLEGSRKSPGWHELTALQQMSTPYDRLNLALKDDDDDNNNNCKSNNRDSCSMMWSPDLSYYTCCRDGPVSSSTTSPRFYAQNEQHGQLSLPFLHPVPYGAPPSHEMVSNAQLYDSIISDFYPNLTANLRAHHWESFEPLYPLENGESKSLKRSTSVEEKKLIVKEERENQPPVKEVKNENSNRPSVPKIKVRKHLVDPNQHPPRLLNQNTQLFRPYPLLTESTAATTGTTHLWHPLFNSTSERNHQKFQWTTPVTQKTSATSRNQ